MKQMKKYGLTYGISLLLAVLMAFSPAAALTQEQAVVLGAEQQENISSEVKATTRVLGSNSIYRPIFSQAGGTYSGSVKVDITTQKGATVYYTLDGSTPTAKSTKYAGTLTIKKSLTLKAVAVVNGKTSSAATAEYVIQVTKPTTSVASGYYTKAQSVELTPMDANTIIYYTTDGKTPTTSSKRYTGAIKVADYTVIKARAYKKGCLRSDILTLEYNIYSQSSTATTDKVYERTYKWNDGQTSWNYSLSFKRSTYQYYYKKKNYNSRTGFDYAAYVTDTEDDAFMKEIADGFLAAAKEKDYNDYQIVMMFATFVQEAIPYKSDYDSTGQIEFPKYPIVTLCSKCGDCEDTAILLASLLRAAGYDCILLMYDDHMAVGVSGSFSGSYYTYKEKQYFYIETTASGWKIGEIPNGYDYATFLPV